MRDPLDGNMDSVRRETEMWKYLTILSTLALGSCDLLGPDIPKLGVEMDVTSFTGLPPDSIVTVAYRVTNHGSAPAYIAACGDHPVPGVDRLTSTSWQDYLGSACLANVSMAPLPLAPGQSIDALWSWNVIGTYRFRVYYGDGAGSPWASSVLGPAFTLR
jgi:hypothetical protein